MATTEIMEPGTIIATSEEALPGDGTYDDGEDIRAARYGTLRIDRDLHAHIDAPKTPAKIEKGDIIIGRAAYIREEFASVEIIAVRGKEDRQFHHTVEATLHVSKTDQGYVKDMADKIRIGDLIRAKVIGLRGGPQLATDKPDLGVVHSVNTLNGVLFERKADNRLICPESGRIVARKVASDYGSGRV